MDALKEATQLLKDRQTKFRDHFDQLDSPVRSLVDGLTRSLAEYIHFGDQSANGQNLEKSTQWDEHVDTLYHNMSLYLNSPLAKSEWLQISQDMVDDFARVTGDEQWIHIDPVKARKESPFRGTIVHGYFILSLLPKLTQIESLVKKMSGNHRMIVNSGFGDVEFRSPLKTGSKIRVCSTLDSIQRAKRGVDATFLLMVEARQEGNVCCLAESRIKVIV